MRTGQRCRGGVLGAPDRWWTDPFLLSTSTTLPGLNTARTGLCFSSVASDFEAAEALEERRKVQLEMRDKILEAIEHRKGRGFSDPWDVEDLLLNDTIQYETLPDWDPKFISPLAKEKLRLLGEKSDDNDNGIQGKIPTLEELAEKCFAVEEPPPHPSRHAKAYALHRQRQHYAYVRQLVIPKVQKEIPNIRKKLTPLDQQEAVDELFESIEFELKKTEIILGKHPKFGKWVERAIEECIQAANKKDGSIASPGETSPSVSSRPTFLDCYREDHDSDKTVPTILYPLALHPRNDNQGRMMEEWLLAAHKKTKRILIRSCTQKVARAIHESPDASVMVTGRRGSGKTALLAAIVASARQSGYITLYLPDGQRYHEFGYYVEPNQRREGMFDLPRLCQDICKEFLSSHANELETVEIDKAIISQFFTSEQEGKLPQETSSIADLLTIAVEKVGLAAPCYSAAVKQLMIQDKYPFLIVADEFNCYFQPGKCFHMDYDPEVKKAIPYERINLFEPLFHATKLHSGTHAPLTQSRIVVSTTESRGVSRQNTMSLIEKASCIDNFSVVEVPRLSEEEVIATIANYECIGLGRLRLDQGKVLADDNEVAYLRAISASNPQDLMNACIIY